MNARHHERLERARVALDGLSVGDAFGSFFRTMHPEAIAVRVKSRSLPAAPWYYTDGTSMALSVYLVLRQCSEIDQDLLACNLARHFTPARGYGMGTGRLLAQVQDGQGWRSLAQQRFGGQGSYGNGAAVRAVMVGAYFADDMDQLIENAHRSAMVTHAHPEAVAGAVAVAAATAVAWQMRGHRPIARAEFIDRVLPYVPASAVHRGIIRAWGLAPETPVGRAVAALGNGSHRSAQDTVPFVFWCAGESLNSYEDALWLAASGGGDVDSICAMVGGLTTMFAGAGSIPAVWLKRRERLPDWPFKE